MNMCNACDESIWSSSAQESGSRITSVQIRIIQRLCLTPLVQYGRTLKELLKLREMMKTASLLQVRI
jgi:hypothetical protein